MNKKVMAGLAMAALVSQASFATADNKQLSRQSVVLAEHLKSIAKANPQDLCAGDVMVASAYTQSAGYALSFDKPQSALVSLAYAQNELKAIINNRTYCVHFAQIIKPCLAELILIQGELDAQNMKKA